MTQPVEIIIQADKPFIDEAELALMLHRTPKQVRKMARRGTIARPLEQAPKGPWVWRVMDLHTFKAQVKTLRAEVANDTTPALSPSTGKVNGNWALEQARREKTEQGHTPRAANG